MKYFMLIVGVAALLLAGGAVAAVAGNPHGTPPGQGECSHGNSGKPCKDDPQPEHGKDCEEHGNHGGVNEDHCKGEENPPPTTTDPTPTTPEPPVEPPKVDPPKVEPPVVVEAPVGETVTVPVEAPAGSTVTVQTPDATTQVTVPPTKVIVVKPKKPGVTRVLVKGKVVKAIGTPKPDNPHILTG